MTERFSVLERIAAFFPRAPCPNPGMGGYAYHGPFEHAVAEEMDQSVEIVLNIIRRFTHGEIPEA